MFMTQAHQQQKPSLGAAAAAAAASTPKPDEKPADKPANATPANDATPTGDGKKKREAKRKVFVVVGTVTEFDSIVQAEKFLNGPEAPETYTVLQGMRTRKSTKVSLR